MLRCWPWMVANQLRCVCGRLAPVRAVRSTADMPLPSESASASAASSSDDVVGEDELFGDLMGDDHESTHREEQDVNPQTASTSDVTTSRHGVNGLAGHEIRANEDSFHKMGYLEAYDAAKDTMLQGGFETGYRETVERAKEGVGLALGKLIASGLMGSSTCITTTKDKEKARKVASTVRTFLDEQTDTPDELLHKLTTLERDVEKILQID